MEHPILISASRRTDIPAFYSVWLINRLREGWCNVLNPFNRRLRRVSLGASDVKAIIFWTRNPEPLFPYLPEIKERGYRTAFLFTIVDYPSFLEPNAPSLDDSIRRFKYLVNNLPPGTLVWRYDPILISKATPESFHINRFEYIAETLSGATHKVIISFVDLYTKVRRRFSERAYFDEIQYSEPSFEARYRLAKKLEVIANKNDISLEVCCEQDLVEAGLPRSHCIGASLLEAIFPGEPIHIPPRPTRQGCGCLASIDIGAYNTCPYGCIYCYANGKRETVLKRFRRHDPRNPLLVPDS